MQIYKIYQNAGRARLAERAVLVLYPLSVSSAKSVVNPFCVLGALWFLASIGQNLFSQKVAAGCSHSAAVCSSFWVILPLRLFPVKAHATVEPGPK